VVTILETPWLEHGAHFVERMDPVVKPREFENHFRAMTGSDALGNPKPLMFKLSCSLGWVKIAKNYIF
jgi:hypothetical protein